MKDKLNAALDAMRDLVVDVLNGTDTNRFARASTLSALASKVAAQGAMGLRDVKPLVRNNMNGLTWGGNPGYDAPEYVNEEGTGYVEGHNNELLPIGAATVYPHVGGAVAVNDQAGLVRQTFMATQTVLAATAKANASSRRTSQAQELEHLLHNQQMLRDSEQHDAADRIQARINQLVDVTSTPELPGAVLN